MSKIKKLLLILIGGPILLIVLLLIGLSLFIDPIARRTVEGGATYALGVPTTLGGASVGIVTGKFGLSNLQVSNVKGYKEKNFLALGDGKVAVSLMSLTKDTIVVPTFTLDTVEINLEKKDGKANYQVIMDNLAKLSKGGPAEPKKPADQGGGKKLIINELTIKKVKVKADLVAVVGGVTIPIDEIKLKNVGKGTGHGVADSGVTVGQLSSIIVQAILGAAAEAGGNLLPGDITKELKVGLDQLGGLKDVGVEVVGQAGEAAKQIGGVVEGAAKEAGKQLEKVGEGLGDQLKGILPGKK